MAYRMEEIARALGGTVLGDATVEIDSVAEPAEAGPRDLAIAMKPEFAEGLPKGRARAALLWEGADWQAFDLEAAVLVARPRMGLAAVTRILDPGAGYAPGIHPLAHIEEGAELGEGVSIGPFSVIARGARIGAGAVIGPQVHVGWNAQIGPGALLHAGVKIGPRARIGARFTAHQGAVIGGDGFSFVTPEAGAVEKARATLGGESQAKAQAWERIHSLGAVEIGDDVEIGCNACIDAGTVRATRVGNGCKIDNLCQIGHNVTVGRDCLMASGVAVAGSTRIGNNVVLGGRVGVSDNIFIGDGVVAGGASIILTNVPAGRVVMGYPAVKMDTHVETYKALRRLPRLLKQVSELQKAVFKPGQND
ncbi:UDP-3-O-(3-hydroxymyristoyl)glucosamine N-acyltransferase [Pseudooceanicola sp. 200-1SW]|uniref:UDP-3-O-(3-hydroxymyristoyl)glucosamine N-acyltransferase n=1 Tax=Pseudooceanicola sp. 200-1SW TaxID=3425949 RepID=UPI003D7F9268